MSTTQDFIDRITKDQLYAFKAGERFNHTVIQEVIERIKPLDLFRSSLASAGFFGNTLLSYTMGKALHSIVKANNNEPLGIGDAQALFSYAMVYTKCLEDATFKASLGEIVPKLGKPNAHLMLGVECSITNGLIHVTIPNQDIIINKDFTLTKHNQGHEALPAAAAADPEDEDFGLAIALSLSHEEQAKHYSSAPTDAAAAAADPEDEDFGLAIALSLSDQKPAQSSGMKALLLKIARLFPEYPQVKEIAAMITKEQLLQLMGDKAVLLREIVQELYNMTDLAQAQALSLRS
ncbi:MAG UNVERIFIED_CONTAM: hypothetical protein LVQ98_09465 [Rickettsiaceae bacterium]|jgi:hypothetical protein